MTAPESSAPIGAVVLAGGRARRFGGRDKGLVRLNGQPLAAWVIRRLAPQVRDLMLSANRNLSDYAALGHPVVADAIPGQAGPLAGIHTAARALRCEWVLTAPCDTPFLPADLASRLLERARREGLDAVYAADDQQLHYSVMLFRRALHDDLAAFLRIGGRKAREWLVRVHAEPVLFEDDPYAFFNVNSPEDLARAEGLALRYA